MSNVYRAAYNMGYVAAKNSQPIDANPYDEKGDSELFESWENGWNDYVWQQAEIEKE